MVLSLKLLLAWLNIRRQAQDRLYCMLMVRLAATIRALPSHAFLVAIDVHSSLHLVPVICVLRSLPALLPNSKLIYTLPCLTHWVFRAQALLVFLVEGPLLYNSLYVTLIDVAVWQ
jgi:hypothetical protein